MPIVLPQPLPPTPDASATVSGKVNLSAQTLGVGPKTVAQVITPIVSNTNGTAVNDVVLKLGTTAAFGGLDSTAKLLKLVTGLGGTEAEQMYMDCFGTLRFPDHGAKSCIEALSSSATAAIVGNGGAGGGVGVLGHGIGGAGVHGTSQSYGVHGESTTSHGVRGAASGTGGCGVQGYSSGTNGSGVVGQSSKYFDIDTVGTGDFAPLRIAPRGALETPTYSADGGVSITTAGAFNWYVGGWKTAAELHGAAFVGEISAPDVKFNPGSAPGTPAEGQCYYDSSAHVLKFRNASTWVDCGGSGSMPDASGTVAGIVNLVDQILGAGVKTFSSAVGMISSPSAAVSGSGEVRLRSNAGALEVSENGGAYAAISGGSIPDASGSVAGKVNLVAQVMGAGTKTFENIVSPSVTNTNGTGASDVCVKIGTSVADGSVNSGAKLLSLLTGFGGTPVEKLSVLKSGYLTAASALAMTSDPTAPVSASGGCAFRSNAGVLQLSQNTGAYADLSVALTVDTPRSLTSSSNHITIDLSAGRNFYHTMTENTTLDAPGSVLAGMSGCIEFTQHASAAKTLGFNAFWKFSGSIVPALSTTVGSKHLLAWYVGNDTSYACCRLIVAIG